MFEFNGTLAFSDSDTPKSYTKELKMSAINDYLSTGMSMPVFSVEYNLSSCVLLRDDIINLIFIKRRCEYFLDLFYTLDQVIFYSLNIVPK